MADGEGLATYSLGCIFASLQNSSVPGGIREYQREGGREGAIGRNARSTGIEHLIGGQKLYPSRRVPNRPRSGRQRLPCPVRRGGRETEPGSEVRHRHQPKGAGNSYLCGLRPPHPVLNSTGRGSREVAMTGTPCCPWDRATDRRLVGPLPS